MNSKGHFRISLLKSLIRILGCVFSIFNLSYLVLGLLLAEILGILEEIVDKR